MNERGQAMNTIIKHTWGQMKQQPFLTSLSMFGTALAVCLIMVEIMMQQVGTIPFAPESNRNRILHVKWMSITTAGSGDESSSNGPMSLKTAKECFFALKSAEAVSAYTRFSQTMLASVPGQTSVGVDIKQVDDRFFRIFDYSFVDGKPFSAAESNAGQALAVITGSVARSLYGTTEVTGKEIELNYVPYRICGVVKDVNSLAETAYAQVWIPYNSTNSIHNSWNNDNMGMFSVVILARSSKDFDKIRRESEQLRVAYNRAIRPDSLFYRGQPETQKASIYHYGANMESSEKQADRSLWIMLLILLIIPAVNLSSMTQSRLRRRITEIGVRRAFGATRSEILQQVLAENLILTLVGGLIGLVFCWIVSYFGSATFFSNGSISSMNVAPSIDPWVLFNPSTFIWVLLLCFILNLLSSLVPAWKASKAVVVDALDGK